MTRFKRTALILFLVASGTYGALPARADGPPAPATSASWRDFTAESANFEILMPGDPAIATQPLDNGKVVTSYEVDLGATYFSVSFNDIDPAWRNQYSPDGMLDRTRDGAVNAVKGTIRTERKFDAGAARGRELIYDTPDGMTLMQSHYLNGDRLFQVTYVGPLKSESQDGVRRFFDSFRFLAP